MNDLIKLDLVKLKLNLPFTREASFVNFWLGGVENEQSFLLRMQAKFARNFTGNISNIKNSSAFYPLFRKPSSFTCKV
jgi:hypothetical protein